MFFFITHLDFILLPFVLINSPLDLRDKLLIEQYLLLHCTEIGPVPFEFQLPSSLSYLHLLCLLRQFLLHVIHLALVYLLDLLVLILDDRDVLLLRASLHPELLGVLMRTLLVLVPDLLLLGLGLSRDLPDLVTETPVLLSHRLGLLLQPSLICLVLRHQLDMVSHYLVVEDLLLLQLLEHSLDLLGHLQVPHSLLLLIGRAVVSHLEQDALVVDSLLLDLSMEGVYLGTQLLGLVVREVDCS